MILIDKVAKLERAGYSVNATNCNVWQKPSEEYEGGMCLVTLSTNMMERQDKYGRTVDGPMEVSWNMFK